MVGESWNWRDTEQVKGMRGVVARTVRSIFLPNATSKRHSEPLSRSWVVVSATGACSGCSSSPRPGRLRPGSDILILRSVLSLPRHH